MATAAVLGFRPHTYWTAAVTMAGTAGAPEVVARRRIDFASGREKFAYHQAAELPLAEAAPLIESIREATVANATREVAALVAELKRGGVAVRLAATAAATAKLPERLEDILAVHARMHAAEGTFYRDVVAAGCAAAGLDVRRVVERELPHLVADHLGVTPAEITTRLRDLGAALGPPWNEDYRLAAEAAWLQLK